MPRWQLAVDPEVHPGPALVHPVTDASVPVPDAFLDVLPYAARPFTARELCERSGAPLSPAAVEQVLHELRVAGLVVPASTVADRVARGALNPWRVLGLPAVGLPLLVACALGVALQLQSVLFFAREALHGMRGSVVVPLVIAVIVVPAARALFRAQVLQATARRARVRLRGVIPTWELEHPLPATRAGAALAHLSGFLFDGIVINVCALSMHAKPFELGYADVDTPVAFLVVTTSLALIAANPLAKYDAYFALEQLLGVADLRGHARARLFQLLSRRRFDAPTLLYALYFVASLLYSLAISAVLLFVAYGFASGLFPADRTLRLGVAAGLVGLVLWRAVRTVHRPVVRALAARRRKLEPVTEGTSPLPAPSATFTPSLHPSEGFPFSFALVESVEERMHDFSSLAPRIDVIVVRAGAVGAGLDLDAPAVRALSSRLFAQPPRALGEVEREALTLAAAAEATLPLERYEPVPRVSLLDGTFKHGTLDVAARVRSASELDVLRGLFAPLRSRHVVERDRIALVFRDKATDRFSHFVLVDENDDAGLRLRLDGLRRCLERAGPRGAVPARSVDAAPGAPAALDVPADVTLAGVAADASAARALVARSAGRAPAARAAPARAALDALGPAQGASSPKVDGALRVAAQLRRSSAELLAFAGCRAVLTPVDVDVVPAAALAWGLDAGLFFPETRDGKTRLGCQIRCPTLVIPTGPQGAPTGLKLRMLAAEPFEPGRRWAAPLARYELLSPHRNFLGGADVDAADLPVWIGDGGAGDSVFVFDGELKAAACRHLLDLPSLSTGGFNHPFQAALAKHLAGRAEPSISFVLDDEQTVYRRGRTDQLLDPVVRTLQLAWRTRALRPSARIRVMRGLSQDGTKLDLDEVAGLAAGPRDEALRAFRGNTADAVDAGALLDAPDVGPYVEALCAFSDRFYGALDEIKRARARGSSAEVRALSRSLVELYEARKRLSSLAAAARDHVRKALRTRRA